MFKSVIAALTAAPLFATAALAGPYANVENGSSWVNGDWDGAYTELHVGYEQEVGEDANVYVQLGPTLLHTEDGTDTEFGAYLGGDIAASDNITVYGELGLLTLEEDMGYSTEVGVRYNF